MQDCMDGIVSLAYENLEGLEEYPESRLYLNFGEFPCELNSLKKQNLPF